MDRTVILNELKCYEEYSPDILNNMSDSELNMTFNKHCEKYAMKVKASDVHNITGTVAIDTPDGYQLLGDYWIKNGKDIYSVKVNDIITKVSGDHLFQTQRGWVYTKDITKDDCILTKEGFRNVQYIRKHKDKEETYDWEVLHENHRYWTASGLSSHNTGKTYLMLNICREAQKQGYSVIWFDSENAVDFEQFVNFGINTKEVRYEPVQTIQEFRTKMVSMLDYLIEEKDKGAEIPKLLVCLDSAGNLPTAKEIEDAKSSNDKSDMTRAKLMRSIFRICMAKLGILNSTLVFTNHVYDSQDMFGGKIQSGGKGSVYGASIILNLSKGKLKEEGNVQTGIRVFAVPNKNRFCIPTPIEFNISYIRGMNPYIGLEKYVSWENCGADRGKFITEKEFEKMKDAEKNACKKVTCTDGTVKYFIRSDSGRYICTDSGEAFGIKELWSDKVFTDERLHRIDEIIKRELAYSKSSDEELEELVDEAEDNDEDLTEE